MSSKASQIATVESAGSAERHRSPLEEALVCLHEAGLHYALLRDDPRNLAELAEVDVLVAPSQRRLAFAALQRAGFLHKKAPHLRHKYVFVRYADGRFYVVDLHTQFVQGGVVYMNAMLALSRRDLSGTFARLSPEDRFVHVLLHNVLGKPRMQDKHLRVLRRLGKRQLDRDRIAPQLRNRAIRRLVEAALDDPRTLERPPREWRKLQRGVRRRLVLGSPGNLLGRIQYRTRGRLRLSRRAVLLVVLGPDGSGKSTLVGALTELLEGGPLAAQRVYMGSWGHDQLPMRALRRFVPPKPDYGALWARARGKRRSLPAEEQQEFVRLGRSPFRILLAWWRCTVKSLIFYSGICVELTYRYLRRIRRCRRPIVISDRYIYDLEFRQGKVAWRHGQGLRRWIYKLFPHPDGVLYLTTPYALVAERKPQLDYEQFIAMDKGFRRVLAPLKPLELVSDVPPDDLAHHFLARYWEALLDRVNRRV